MKRKSSLLMAAPLALLAACSSTPVAPPALVEARATVRTAETNPDVLANAPLELKKASDALSRANNALAAHESDVEVNHAAYLANQRGKTALAVGAAKANEEQIKAAELERERARADARSVEAQRARLDASAQRTQAEIAQAQASAAAQQANIANQQASAAQMQAAQARQQATDATQQAAASQAQAAAAEARATELQRQIDEMEAQKTERGLLVTLGDVLFEFNRAEVKATAQTQLAKLAAFLKRYPERKVSIEGHTDNVGAAGYNQELSTRRAEAVKAQLALLGVAPERLSVVGYGKDFPVAANNSDSNRALNRRVEVIISDTDQPVRARR